MSPTLDGLRWRASSASTCRSACSPTAGATPTRSPGGRSAAAASPCSRSRPGPVWQQPTYAEANRACRELTGKGLSAQAWGLRGKLLEADAYRRKSPAQLYEVHPELAFAALAGAPHRRQQAHPGRPRHPPGTPHRAGLTLPVRVAGAAENDLLDAAAVAWSARRIAAGQAVTLSNPAQLADDDTEIAIRY